MECEKLNRIEWVYPSLYNNLKLCFLKGAYIENKFPPQLSRSPESVLGTVVHRMYELTSRGLISSLKEFDEKWDEELDLIEKGLRESSLEKGIVPIKDTARDYEVKKEFCRLQINDNLKIKAGRRGKTESQVYHLNQEEKIIIPEKSVKGKIDLVIKKGGYIEIIDYKTGNIFEKGSGGKKVKAEIVTQLIFYSGLYFFYHGVWPAKLSVMDQLGNRVNIPYSHADATELIANAQCLMFSINCILENTNITEREKLHLLARPSPTSCKFCNYRPSCYAYINKKMTDTKSGWPTDIFIKIIRIDVPKSGLTTITGRLIDTDKTVRIVNIPKEYLGNKFNPEKKISVFNLKIHFRAEDRYEWQRNSLIATLPNLETLYCN